MNGRGTLSLVKRQNQYIAHKKTRPWSSYQTKKKSIRKLIQLDGVFVPDHGTVVGAEATLAAAAGGRETRTSEAHQQGDLIDSVCPCFKGCSRAVPGLSNGPINVPST